jgi:hypothetical protein
VIQLSKALATSARFREEDFTPFSLEHPDGVLRKVQDGNIGEPNKGQVRRHKPSTHPGE